MRHILTAFIAEHGVAALVAEVLGVAAVFALLGLAFAFPASVEASSSALTTDRADTGSSE